MAVNDELIALVKASSTTEDLLAKGETKDSLLTSLFDLVKSVFSADKKQVSEESVDPAELMKGIKVEHEHTSSDIMAKEIALDHLTEDAQYYEHLDDMENKYEHNDAPKKESKFSTVFINSKTAIVTMPRDDFTGDTVQIHRIAEEIGQYGNVVGYKCESAQDRINIIFKLAKACGE